MKSKKERKEKRQSIFKEFIAFINKGNAIALAIGVILGGAFNAIVTAINKNIISPIIALCLGDTDLTNSLQTVLKYRTADATDVANGLATTVGEQIPGIVISWGAFIQSVIDFLLIAMILFAMVKITSSIVNKAKAAGEKLVKKNKEDEPVEETPEVVEPAVVEVPQDIELLTEIRDLLKENNEKKYHQNKSCISKAFS